MRVKNMKNNKGNIVKNQFIISDDSAIWFQSYNTIIAKKTSEGIFLDINAWDYSRTTGKYRNIFLNETKRETEQKIKDEP